MSDQPPLEDLLLPLLRSLSVPELVAWADELKHDPGLSGRIEALEAQPRAAAGVAAASLKWATEPAPYTRLLALRPNLRAPIVAAARAAGHLLAVEPGPQLVGVSAALGELSARLEGAWQRLEAAGEAGDAEAVERIQAEILEIRREIRGGPALRAGDFLGGGRYKLTERLGHGGFATVWGAWDRRVRRSVAIKVLHHQHSEDRSRLERFFRGARLMSELRHPAVVRVFDPRCEHEGYHYFVMERLLGGDLHDAVRGRRLGAEPALAAVLEVGAALAYAHGRGVVHRDVKPQNILLDAAGRACLTDFDLVKAADTTGGTRSGALGTFLYAAPEALRAGHAADGRADVFSLAMTAVFCLFGMDVPAEALYEREAFLAGLDCAAAVRAVLSRATAIRPEQRYPSMEAFCEALADALAMPGRAPEQELSPAVAGEGRYSPLKLHLQAKRDAEASLTLTFAEIEAILGFKLPVSARKHRGWWANHAATHAQASAWLDAGYRVGLLSLSQEVVTFNQLFGLEGDYVAFFGGLIPRLQRAAPNSPVWDSPNGQSGHNLLPLAWRGATVGWIRAAFSRDRSLRVEAYLDTGDQDGTQRLFDRLLERRQAIEGGQLTLGWERLPANRASRVVAKLGGRITDPPDALERLSERAAETAARLYQAVQGVLDTSPDPG